MFIINQSFTVNSNIKGGCHSESKTFRQINYICNLYNG